MATKKKTAKTPAPKAPASPAAEPASAPASAAPERGSDAPPASASAPAPRPTEPAPDRSAMLTPNARDAVYEAARLEARDRGMNDREAASFADEVCDRLRYTDREDDHIDVSADVFIDLRAEQDYVYPGRKRKVKMNGGAPVMRNPADVDAIVIHQTACEFGVSRRAAKLAGSIEGARAKRALDVACHALAFRNGYFVAAHDLRVYVNHGNRFNDRSLGLEIEGRYPGLADDVDTLAREDLDTTWGGAPTELTDQTVKTACAALKWLVDEGRKQGMPIKYVFAHRQSSDNRRSDPGEELWKRVVLDYAVAELGLISQPESKWRQGYAIPESWDPENGIGKY